MERGIRLPQSHSEWGFKGENYLLLIGIDKYTHWKPLNNAVKDVRDISRLLTERYQFEPDKVFTLFDAEATEDNIRQKLMHVKKTITPEDNLVVFFSGHGYYDQDLEEGYWVPANARKNSPSDYISNSDVLKWIRSIKTHHTLILVDSCFSGTLVSQSRSEVLSEKYPSCRIFASGRKELVDDGTPGTNSPFAKAILTRLNYNTDRVLRASELIHHVTKNVESQGGQAPVEGRIKDAGDEGGEFVFHLKITEEEIWRSVAQANSHEEYRKYLEYFPDGRYALTARTRVSELTDEADWKRANELSTAQSFTQYIESHPGGFHHEEAIRCLGEIEENDAWNIAKTRNTVSSYLDYLRKYPSGRFESLARKNLETLKHSLHQQEKDLMQDELEVIAGKTELANTDKEQYKLLVNEAEAHYAKMEYRESIPKYQEALSICKPHFVPAKAFLVQRLDSSKRRIQYLEHYSEGEKAMHAGNYDLAIEFFKQAMSSEDNAQVREALKLAERRGKTIAPPPVRPKQKKKSSASGLWWIAGVLIVAILGYAVFAIVDSTRNIRNTYDRLSQDASDITNEDIVENTDATLQAQQNAITPGEFIPGSWKVERMEVAGQPFGTNPTVHFYPDGRLVFDDPSGQLSGTWSSLLNYMELYLPEYSAKGTITEIDKERMTWNTVVNNRGFESNATWYLARISGN